MKSIIFAFAVATLFSMSAMADEAKSVAACCGKEQCVCKTSQQGGSTNQTCDVTAKSGACPMTGKAAKRKQACCTAAKPEVQGCCGAPKTPATK